MIPTEYHQNVFERAKRGYPIDFTINKVPNSRLNFYAGRTGRILNIRCKPGRTIQIEWLEVLVESLSYGKPKVVSFPVEHITINKPVKKTYSDYSYTEREHMERVVDAFEPEHEDEEERESDDIYDE